MAPQHHSFYCSELARAAGETTFGTASVGETWFLVEYPLTWKPKAFEGSVLAPEVKAHLAQTLKSVPRARLLFVRRDNLCRERFAFFVVRSRERAPEIFEYELDSYERLTEIDLAAIASGDARAAGESNGRPRERPLFLVCTHGRHDKCCAKFGFPLYKRLRDYAGDGSVWQASHVGGDRFAANLVCFPHGLFYGRVDERGGERIIADYRERGQLVLENFRGRSCYPHFAQAAECYVRLRSGLLGVEDLRRTGQEREGADGWRVRFDGAGGAHEALVAARASDAARYLSCHAAEEKLVFEYRLEEYRMAGDSRGSRRSDDLALAPA